ncbi:MAG TPA: RNA polymerase sigma factor [Ktedonobacteraceae bacterium]|nr:RNA polymerase sigma factor [Ktedonobacteraceae bacterium]
MKVLNNEAQLTVAACQGSVEAFEALIRYYEPRIKRMLYSLSRDYSLTQDLCQETFLAAYRALPRMKGEELHFAPWLYRIALNQLRSEWRRRKRVTWIPFSPPQGSEEDAFDESGEDYLVCPERFEEQVGQRDLIQRVLARLPKASAVCLVLDTQGFSYREIAEALQASQSSVRSRLSRARQTFRQFYTILGYQTGSDRTV